MTRLPGTPPSPAAARSSSTSPPGPDLLGALDLAVEAARRAGADAGGRLLERVELVASVMSISLRHPDPGGLVAERLGLAGRPHPAEPDRGQPAAVPPQRSRGRDRRRAAGRGPDRRERSRSTAARRRPAEVISELDEPLPAGEPAPLVRRRAPRLERRRGGPPGGPSQCDLPAVRVGAAGRGGAGPRGAPAGGVGAVGPVRRRARGAGRPPGRTKAWSAGGDPDPGPRRIGW